MNKKIHLADLLPFIEEAFSRNTSFKINITGTSMNPFLYEGRDYVLIEKPVLPLRLGDVPLYRRSDGSFVLHRVVEIKNGTYTMCGDNQVILERGITDDNIIGVATSFCVNGKLFREDDEEYTAYKKKCVKNVRYRYPRKRLSLVYHKLIKK